MKIAITDACIFIDLYELQLTNHFFSLELEAMVLSSDKAVRSNAKKKSIEYHGMIWIFDKLVETSVIKPIDAASKLKTLIVTNIVYQNNAELVTEMNKRLKAWSNEE